MNIFKSKFFIICLVVAILLTLIPTLLAAFGGTDLLRSALGTLAKPFVMCGSGIANAFNGFVDVFTEYDELLAENERLKGELESLKDGEYDNSLLQEQNDWLKEYLDLRGEQPELIMTEAGIISREAGNYSTVVTLNKGSVHGIKKNMPVVTSDGVLGYVNELGLDWCRVVMVIETASSVGVYTDRAGVLGVVEGNADLRREGLCQMTYIEKGSDIQVGDKVYTSGGEGSIYPSGLLLGRVKSVDINESTGTMVAKIEPAVDFGDMGSLYRVMILCGYAASEQ